MADRVLIIGGGVIGLCCAYYCARDGAAVTILEREVIGAGSSGENAGLVVPSHFIPLAAPGAMMQGLKWMLNSESPFYIKPRFDTELISWLLKFRKAATERQARAAMPLLRDLAWKSLRLYEQLSGEEHLEFGFQKRGLLMLYATATGEHACRHEADLARQIGVEAEVLDRSRLEELEPHASFGAAGGVYYPGDAHLSPSAFLGVITHRLREMGVTILPGTVVLGIDGNGTRGTTVRTSSGVYEADVCVIAGGAWSHRLVHDLRVNLPLQPGKGYSVTINRPSLRLTIPSILTEAHIAVTPLGNQLRLAGTMELAGHDLSINMRRVDAIIRAVPRYYPGFAPAAADREHPWRGLRPCSPDGLPYLGRLRSYRNLIVATGHAMVGMSLGPVTGTLVADLVAGRSPSIDIGLLEPERFS
jgi:D-amino-acid dehydrogenase